MTLYGTPKGTRIKRMRQFSGERQRLSGPRVPSLSIRGFDVKHQLR